MEDYIVRYGNDNGNVQRSFYMNKQRASRFYGKIKLDTKTTWKELLYEPLDQENVQKIVKSDGIRVVDLGICKIAIPTTT